MLPQRLFRRHYCVQGWTTIRSMGRQGILRRSCNRHISKRYLSTESSSSLSRGLFSLSSLRHPGDFVKIAQQAMTDCDVIRQDIVNSNSSSSNHHARQTLFRLDAISRHVCNVIDAAELARSVHASLQWREAASRAFTLLSDYIAQLNGDPVLYEALRHVDKSHLNEEEIRFVHLLQAEFERDGIHLPKDKRQELRELQNRLTQLESVFQRNIVTYQKDFFVSAADVHAVVPQHILQSFGRGIGDANPNDDTQLRLCQNAGQILQTLIKYAPSAQLRQEVYMAHHTAVPENLPVLSALVQTRHELATTVLGFESYADRFLRDKMAGSPQGVLDFLQQVQTQIQPLYRQEMAVLQNVKQHVEGTSSSSSSSEIQPWDVSFYSNLVQNQKDGFDVQMISQYLSLPHVLEGMQRLVLDLFGIQMKEEEMTAIECWDIDDDARAHNQTTQSHVRRFSFWDGQDETPLGIMYLDLYPRDGKYNHAAHFTVRCGCRTSLEEEDNDDDDDDDISHFQLPIVALVCNFSSPDAMTHSEVETLFHEFGHGLHSLLSRTKFQHMSGTRGAMDFVETPSHLMEHFCWDASVLKKMAKHNVTQEPIPDTLIEQLRQSRYQFSAIERQNQILYALFDQTLFGGNPRMLEAIAQDPHHATTRIFAGLHQQLGIPYAEGTHWQSRFGHLVTYGAGYYGYLYAQVFAGDLWHELFEGKEQDRRASGERLWHGMLQHGGSKDPTAMLTELLGRPPRVDSYSSSH